MPLVARVLELLTASQRAEAQLRAVRRTIWGFGCVLVGLALYALAI